MMGDTNRCHKRAIHLVIDACFMEFILVIVILYLLAIFNSFLLLFPTSLLPCLCSLYFYSHPSLPFHPIDTTIMQTLTVLCLTVSFSLDLSAFSPFSSYNQTDNLLTLNSIISLFKKSHWHCLDIEKKSVFLNSFRDPPTLVLLPHFWLICSNLWFQLHHPAYTVFTFLPLCLCVSHFLSPKCSGLLGAFKLYRLSRPLWSPCRNRTGWTYYPIFSSHPKSGLDVKTDDVSRGNESFVTHIFGNFYGKQGRLSKCSEMTWERRKRRQLML